jgi:threonine/homoserine/homoserine lactone efflux protein
VLDHQVLVFTGVAALLTITPGPDTFLVIRNVLRGGRAAGVVTTLGVCCGLFVHAALSALGLSVVLTQSTNAYLALKWAGALYLMSLVGLAFLFDRGRRVLASARAHRSIGAVSGTALLGCGVRLAFEDRR